MSRLVNEDWEHAAYANDKLYEGERQYRMELEWQEWEYEQQKKRRKKPAVIIVNKMKIDENAHNSTDVSRTHQKKL